MSTYREQYDAFYKNHDPLEKAILVSDYSIKIVTEEEFNSQIKDCLISFFARYKIINKYNDLTDWQNVKSAYKEHNIPYFLYLKKGIIYFFGLLLIGAPIAAIVGFLAARVSANKWIWYTDWPILIFTGAIVFFMFTKISKR